MTNIITDIQPPSILKLIRIQHNLYLFRSTRYRLDYNL